MRSKIVLSSFLALCASDATAGSLSWSTRMSCYSDYYAYCSMHTAGSAGCHACMRANRARLSGACVSALIGDGVLKDAKATPGQTKAAPAQTKIAGAANARAAKASGASRPQRQPLKTRVAKTPAAKTIEAPIAKATETPVPKPETQVAKDVQQASPEQPPRAPNEPAPPQPTAKPGTREQPSKAAGMDHQTFEALKNRAPYFVLQEDIASIFSRADEKPSASPAAGR